MNEFFRQSHLPFPPTSGRNPALSRVRTLGPDLFFFPTSRPRTFCVFSTTKGARGLRPSPPFHNRYKFYFFPPHSFWRPNPGPAVLRYPLPLFFFRFFFFLFFGGNPARGCCSFFRSPVTVFSVPPTNQKLSLPSPYLTDHANIRLSVVELQFFLFFFF